MADDEDKKQGQEERQGVTLDQVRDMVRSMLGAGGAKAADGGAAPGDVSAQVEDAVRKVHQGQEAERARAALEKRVKELEETKVPERKPKEYRRITRRIWGDDDDD